MQKKKIKLKICDLQNIVWNAKKLIYLEKFYSDYEKSLVTTYPMMEYISPMTRQIKQIQSLSSLNVKNVLCMGFFLWIIHKPTPFCFIFFFVFYFLEGRGFNLSCENFNLFLKEFMVSLKIVVTVIEPLKCTMFCVKYFTETIASIS